MCSDYAALACCCSPHPPHTSHLPAGVVSPVPLMQAGLAYVSVHTSQSGQGPELRGQLMPYGKVMGNSAAIAK